MHKNSVFIFSIGMLLQIHSVNSLAADVLSSHLKNLHGEFLSYSSTRPASTFNSHDKTVNVVRNQNVIVEITAKSIAQVQPLLTKLRTLGATQTSSYKKQISAMLPINKLSLLNNYSEISWISSNKPKSRTVKIPRSRGFAFNAANQAMFTDVVRKKYNVDGTGISIGVMSDSFNCIDEEENGADLDALTGDLPPKAEINVLKEYPFCRDEEGNLLATDEGRAMMQLIHDIAPGAKLMFYTATVGATDFAAGIQVLTDAGANVIVDDVGYFTMPMFQEGPIAQSVNEAKKRGVSYFSAAGNSARSSYEMDYTEGEVLISRDKAHDFGRAAGQASDFYQQITLPLKQPLIISLQWDDPAEIAGGEGAKTDLDFFLLNTQDNSIVISSQDSNIGHNPVEIFAGSLVRFGEAETEGKAVMNLYISHRAGPVPKRIKYIISGPTAPWPIEGAEEEIDIENIAVSIDEYNTQSSTIFGHPNASGAIAVGAIPYQETPWFGTADELSLIESFSSAGGTPIFFSNNGQRLSQKLVRFKPDIIAPDNSDTTFFGVNTDFNNFPNFQGTSAAAPNAAALAVLLKQAFPHLSPDAIALAMTQGSINLNDPSLVADNDAPINPGCRVGTNFDFGTGCGLVQADLVFEQDGVFLSLETSTRNIKVGVPFTYHLKLKNLSDQALHNVRIRALELPKFVDYLDVQGCINIDYQEVSCQLGTIPAGQIRDVAIKVMPDYSPDGRYPFKVDLLTDTSVDLSNTQADQNSSIPVLAGDLNSDGCVDLSDWSFLFAALRAGGSYKESLDLNGDQKFDSADLTKIEDFYTNPSGAACS